MMRLCCAFPSCLLGGSQTDQEEQQTKSDLFGHQYNHGGTVLAGPWASWFQEGTGDPPSGSHCSSADDPVLLGP